MQRYHTPVMVQEIVRWLNLKSGSKILDVTLGGGGHALALLDATSPDGVLFGIDRDDDAIREATDRLADFGSRVKIFKARMGEMSRVLSEVDAEYVDAIVADLGVSSFQLDDAGRGFSFMKDAQLDMRMDRSAGITAADLIESLDEKKLAEIIWEFGEERFSRRIARAIAGQKIDTTGELVKKIVASLPPNARHGKIHPATRTFQALRIAVNDEMNELKDFLECAPRHLSAGGRMAIISYHSLEDRQVKRAFRKCAAGGEYLLPVKKPIMPSENEVETNPRARSAKMRLLERRSAQ